MPKPQFIKKYDKVKILMLGDSNVGKSTLVNILRGKKQQTYTPTIFDNIYHYLEIDGDFYQLDIRDTSGAPEYANLITRHLNEVDLVLICYAVDNRTSFYNIGSYWRQQVSEVPIIMLGLKIDLRYDQDIDSNVKIVTYEEGAKRAEQLRCGYQEFCETNNEKQQSENIEELFRMCLNYMLENKSENTKAKNKNNQTCLVC